MASLTSSLTVKLIDDVTKPARTVAQALEQAGKEAKKVAEAMKGSGATDKFGTQLSKLKIGAKDIEQVSKAWKDYSATARLAATAADWTKEQALGVRRWEAQTIHALKAVQREEAAFQRAQKKARQPPASAGHGGHGGPSQFGHGGAAGFVTQGAAGAVSAHSVYHVSREAVLAGAELQHERVASLNSGRTAVELKELEDAATRVAINRPTASYTESMKTLLETTSSFGSVEHAIEHLDFMMKTASVLKSASGGKISESAGEMGQQFAKFFEMRGVAGDAHRFEAEGNEMVRAMAFSGGTFNPREMFHFAQRAKSALRNYDLEYISRVAPSIIGESSGDTAGTGANAFYNVVMGKARDKKQAAEWMKYGLLDPKLTEMKNGQATSWSAGAVKGTDLAMRNPLRWFEEVVLPAMQQKGVKVDDAGELSKVLATMFRNGMSNQFANENAQLADRQRLHKDKGLIDKNDHPNAMYARNLSSDPLQALTALKASLENLGAAASSPAMQTAAGAISAVAGSLQQLAAAAKDHPMLAMTAGGTAAAAGMAGAGYLSYQFLNGFGLKTAAVELSGAAAALTAAAEKQGVAGALGGGAGQVPGTIGKVLKALPLVGAGVVAAEVGTDVLEAYRKAHPEKFNAHGGGEAGYWRTHGGGPRAEAGPTAYGHWETTPGRARYGGGSRHWVDETKAQAAEVEHVLQSINTSVTPTIDTSGMIAAQAAAARLLATLQQITGAAKGAASTVNGINVPSIGPIQRSHFKVGGIGGGD